MYGPVSVMILASRNEEQKLDARGPIAVSARLRPRKTGDVHDGRGDVARG